MNHSNVLSGCSILGLQNTVPEVHCLLAQDFARCEVCNKSLFDCVQVDQLFRTYRTCKLEELCQRSSFKKAVLPVGILVQPCDDVVANHAFFNHSTLTTGEDDDGDGVFLSEYIVRLE